MKKSSIKKEKRTRRHARIRSQIKGTDLRPRLCVFRSNTAIYAQLIDDVAGQTLVASSSTKISGSNSREKARAVGSDIAAKAVKLGVTKAVFDRGGFLFAGSIKEVADGAREGGLIL